MTEPRKVIPLRPDPPPDPFAEVKRLTDDFNLSNRYIAMSMAQAKTPLTTVPFNTYDTAVQLLFLYADEVKRLESIISGGDYHADGA
jgi:hypothetical protein